MPGHDDADLHDLELELERSIVIDELASFVRAGWHVLEPTTELVWGLHMQAICDHLQASHSLLVLSSSYGGSAIR